MKNSYEKETKQFMYIGQLKSYIINNVLKKEKLQPL